MAYTLIEQFSLDLDLFLIDNELKLIHIASGGGQIPTILVERDTQHEEFLENISEFEEQNEIDINPNLSEILGFTTDQELRDYLTSFIEMARRGFYSYDKTKLGLFDDETFHLVAWPKNHNYNRIGSILNKVLEPLLKINKTFPIDFNTFNLFKIFDDSASK